MTRALTVTAAVGSAAVGGVFFAFSAFVMSGLRRLPAPQGIAAMQSINVTAVRAPLMVALFGTAALCVGLALHAGLHWGDRRSVLLVAAAVVYVLGVVVLTGTYSVPRNDALAALDAAAPASADVWATYLREWTAANHVRTVAGLAASTLYVLALI